MFLKICCKSGCYRPYGIIIIHHVSEMFLLTDENSIINSNYIASVTGTVRGGFVRDQSKGNKAVVSSFLQ